MVHGLRRRRRRAPGRQVAGLSEAIEDLVGAIPTSLPISVTVAFRAAVRTMALCYPIAADGLDRAAGVIDDWPGVNGAALRSVLRVGAGPALILLLTDNEVRGYIGEGLDTRPSETLSALWALYGEHLLRPDEAEWVAGLPATWADAVSSDNSFKMSAAVVRALRQAAGFEGEPTTIESLVWGHMLTTMAKATRDTYWALLDEIAEKLGLG